MTTKRLPADHDPETTILPFADGRGHYNANIAKNFFKTFGKKESFEEGHVFFKLDEKSRKKNIFQKPLSKALFTKLDSDLFRRKNIHRMFLLTKGEVTLKVRHRLLDRARAGDIFGEMAVISEIPDIDVEMHRSATAKAVAPGVAYSLDGAETEAGLAQQPEFALMLMSAMFERLRVLTACLADHAVDDSHKSLRSEPVFDPATVGTLADRVEKSAVVRFPEGARIIKEKGAGTSMYVVLEGAVGVAVGRRIVEKIGVGGVFGEMALVDNAPRAATVVAREECSVLMMNRDALLALVRNEPAVGMSMMRSVAERLRYMNSLFDA
ncbi:MAG: cyclic nucleotide-binding domain-containing protein [Betaproteobacteria bacterium]|nr:cyclic nucleotide-binding domain-containing protein [Betaproteobacteria bacterium]